jgi:LysR family transcriptional regulator for metE and metH
LVERTPRGLRTTDAGRELVAAADRIDADLESCRQAIAMIVTGKVGSVALGAVSTAKYFAPQALAAFWRSHPDVDVKLLIGNRRETVANIDEHNVDMAIMGRPPEELDLETVVIGPHPHVVIASPRHPLARRRKITLDRVCDEVFLVREIGSGTRNLTDWLFTGAGRQLRIGMEILSNETIKQAVIADLGVALLSAHTVAAEMHDGRLVALDVVGTPVLRQWYAVRRNHEHLGPAGIALWQFLVDHAVDHLPIAVV